MTRYHGLVTTDTGLGSSETRETSPQMRVHKGFHGSTPPSSFPVPKERSVTYIELLDSEGNSPLDSVNSSTQRIETLPMKVLTMGHLVREKKA